MFWKREPVDPDLYKRLVKEQNELREQVVISKLDVNIKIIAGCDSALKDEYIISVFVNFDYPSLEILEISYDYQKITLPYVPGFLAFREMPTLLKAYEKLDKKPDIIMVDGNGIIHPRRLGVATHLGIKINKPTIGVAKNKLCGSNDMPSEIKGSYTEVIDKGELIGYALRSKDKVKPIFVSPGHLCNFDTALDLTMKTLLKHKLPEPTRLADYYSKEYKNRIVE